MAVHRHCTDTQTMLPSSHATATLHPPLASTPPHHSGKQDLPRRGRRCARPCYDRSQYQTPSSSTPSASCSSTSRRRRCAVWPSPFCAHEARETRPSRTCTRDPARIPCSTPATGCSCSAHRRTCEDSPALEELRERKKSRIGFSAFPHTFASSYRVFTEAGFLL